MVPVEATTGAGGNTVTAQPRSIATDKIPRRPHQGTSPEGSDHSGRRTARTRRQHGDSRWVRLIDLLALYFPGALVLLLLAMVFLVLTTPLWWLFLLVLATPYLLPLTLFRLLMWLAPIKEGRSLVAKGVWSSWFISYRLQLIYGYFPCLENLLLCFPGLFSMWLRAWGSRVGKGVFWAATVQITDRGHLNIGDGAFFGSQVYLSPHVVQRRGQWGVLYFKTITIGQGAFVGAGCRMGPGVTIRDEARVSLLTDLYLNETFPKESA